MPSVIATGRALWKIYGALTFIAISLIMFTCLSLWEAVNLAFSAVSSGGFTLHEGGVLYYNSRALELLLIPIMIAGALPFKLYYQIIENRRLSLFGDEQVKLFFLFVAIGASVVTYDLVFFGNFEVTEAIHQGLFMVVSSLTTTGFQNATLRSWAGVTVYLSRCSPSSGEPRAPVPVVSNFTGLPLPSARCSGGSAVFL